MATAHVFYTVFENVDEPINTKLIDALPKSVSQEIKQYKIQDDINRLTAGKYLLKYALKAHKTSKSVLENYQLNEMGKPFIPEFRPFNITHSGQVVACVVLQGEGLVGIDTEKIRTIDPPRFSKQFSPPEMQKIITAENPQDQFFEFWTQKEAVMKADGRGMRISLHSIRLNGNIATIDDREDQWFLYSLDLHDSVKSHLCSNQGIDKIEIIFVELQELFS